MIVYAEPKTNQVQPKFSLIDKQREFYNKRILTNKGYPALKEDIKKNGIVHPLIGNSWKGFPYTVKIGLRRFWAARELGIERIPILIYDLPIYTWIPEFKVNCEYKYRLKNMEDIYELFKAVGKNYPKEDLIPAGQKYFVNLYGQHGMNIFR